MYFIHTYLGVPKKGNNYFFRPYENVQLCFLF